MEKKSQKIIQGASFSTQNGHLLVSSGIQSLDTLLGGGIPVGTVVLIEEDFHGSYSKIILKYFLAEGIVSKHSTLIASQDVNPSNIVSTKTYSNPAYNDLLKSIKNKIKEGKFFLKDSPEKRSILRIGVHSLGSPMWLPHRKSLHSIESTRDLDMFIFCLRALVRSAYSVAVITIPTHLYHEISLDRCIHSSDIAMRLQAFSGTELEHNQSLSEYHGFFYLTKLAAINSLSSKHPGSVEYAFKLRRKRFSIDMLHLPPDIQDDGDGRRENVPFLGCGGNTKKSLLDF
nr:elongator complex protein 4 [Leptinotarsa decemlineata]